MTEEFEQKIRDEEHLKLLSLGYKVSAGFTVFFSLFALLYVFIGLMLAVTPFQTPSQNDVGPPPPALGWFFAGISFGGFAYFVTLAILKWFTAQYIKQRRSLLFCQFIAAISCLEIPYGTLLGVLTFIVTSRPSVKSIFKNKNENTSTA